MTMLFWRKDIFKDVFPVYIQWFFIQCYIDNNLNLKLESTQLRNECILVFMICLIEISKVVLKKMMKSVQADGRMDKKY